MFSPGGMPGQPGGPGYIQVSPEEKEAIERLEKLGQFPRALVIQVYFACEKNETLAANVLLNQMGDEMDGDQDFMDDQEDDDPSQQ